eukprot:4645812-Pleurochrysis_carterae.AAC.3
MPCRARAAMPASSRASAPPPRALPRREALSVRVVCGTGRDGLGPCRGVCTGRSRAPHCVSVIDAPLSAL